MSVLPWTASEGPLPIVAFGNSLGAVQASWGPLLHELGGSRATLTFDLPGHYDESIAPFDFDKMAEDVAQTIRAHSDAPVVLCGVSLGGALAVRVAADHPELACAVVVVNAPVAQPDPALWHARARAIDEHGLEPFAETLHERWFSADAEPSMIEAVRADFRALPAAGYANACRAIADLDIRDAASRVSVPAVIVRAADDIAVAASNSDELATLIPHSHLIHVPGAHLLPAENPRAVIDAIDMAIALIEETS
ncbi:alpha/beta fold hydrolase [Microbacterium sp.]|uniref:alpha/beta fold hydrolase n=1 Tax=Microbacterium sp. TaxID=51671 RepID=UPI002B7D6847|nr:alpha/beta fold hydrolase [Microbacterium sp.]HWK76279.1 alpha/beta fold hydrolase [Microbacterium sp.]